MRLDGRRESSNVEDRRGMSGGTAAGIGLGGVALIALIVLLQGGSLGDVVKSVINSGGIQTTQQSSYEPTPDIPAPPPPPAARDRPPWARSTAPATRNCTST